MLGDWNFLELVFGSSIIYLRPRSHECLLHLCCTFERILWIQCICGQVCTILAINIPQGVVVAFIEYSNKDFQIPYVWTTYLDMSPLHRILFQYCVLLIYRDIVHTRNSQKTTHRSPVTARYGVSFVSSGSEENCALSPGIYSIVLE